MFPIPSSSSSTLENNWRTYYDAKRLIRQTEQRLNETRTIYPHVHLSNHYETIDHGHLSTSLSSNSFFHRTIYPSEERSSTSFKMQLRDSEALQTIRRKINRQKLAAERRAEQFFHSQSDAGHLFDHYRPTSSYSTSASLQNLHYSPHRQKLARPSTVLSSSNRNLSQSQSFPSELDTVMKYPSRTTTNVLPIETRSSQQRSASASTGLATKSSFHDLPSSRLESKTNRRPGDFSFSTDRRDLFVTRKPPPTAATTIGRKTLFNDRFDDDEDEENSPFALHRSSSNPQTRKDSTRIPSMKKDLFKRLHDGTNQSLNKRPSSLTAKEFTEQTRHRLLRLLGSSTDHYPSTTFDQTSSILESSSSSSSDSIIEIQSNRFTIRSHSEPPVENGETFQSNGQQRHDNLLRWAAKLTDECDLVENHLKYSSVLSDHSPSPQSDLQFDDGNLRPSSASSMKNSRDRAATTIQAAYRSYTARKSLSSLNEKEKRLNSEFNQRGKTLVEDENHCLSNAFTPINDNATSSSSSITPVPSRRRSSSPPLPPAMSPDNGRPLPSVDAKVSTTVTNLPEQKSPTVKKRKSRSPARHRTTQTSNPSASSPESILTEREKLIWKKYNGDLNLQDYEKRLKDIEKKIRLLVKRAIEIFDEKRTTKTLVQEDFSQQEKSDASSTVASSETAASDVSDLEKRVQEYSEQLKAKKKELERLKRQNKEKLRRQENELIRKIESYDQRIESLRRQTVPTEQTVPSPVNSSHQDSLTPPVPVAAAPVQEIENLVIETSTKEVDEPDTPRDAQSLSTMIDVVEEEKAMTNGAEHSTSSSISPREPSPDISPVIVEEEIKPSEILPPASPIVADYNEDFSEVKTVTEELNVNDQVRPTRSSASETSRSSDEKESVILYLGEKSVQQSTEEGFPPAPSSIVNEENTHPTQDDPTTMKDSSGSSSSEDISDQENPRSQNSSPKDDSDNETKTFAEGLDLDQRNESNDNEAAEPEVIAIDLSRLEEKPAEEPVKKQPVVSHTVEQVLQISHDALTILLDQNQRFDDRKRIDRTIPEWFFDRFDPHEAENGDASRSRRAYARMIFDLCVELLHELDSPNIQLSPHPEWQRSKLISKRFFRFARPATREQTEELIQKKILEILNLTPREIVYSKWRLPIVRRRDLEQFELVLDEELRRTETLWINYDDDTIRIKFDLAERIFQQLIDETLDECLQLINKRIQSSA